MDGFVRVVKCPEVQYEGCDTHAQCDRQSSLSVMFTSDESGE